MPDMPVGAPEAPGADPALDVFVSEGSMRSGSLERRAASASDTDKALTMVATEAALDRSKGPVRPRDQGRSGMGSQVVMVQAGAAA
jgi:hypothetical protein